MSPLLLEHEGPAELLASFVAVLTDELALPRRNGGSVTLRRRQKQRGLEPDKCFWIANATRIRGKHRIDLRVDPPPDLGIEVDHTRSSLKRMRVYATLRVPEVWRWRKGAVAFHILRDGTYRVEPASLAFPHLQSEDVTRFAALYGETDDSTLVRQFREWVKQQLPIWQPPIP